MMKLMVSWEKRRIRTEEFHVGELGLCTLKSWIFRNEAEGSLTEISGQDCLEAEIRVVINGKKTRFSRRILFKDFPNGNREPDLYINREIESLISKVDSVAFPPSQRKPEPIVGESNVR